MNLCSQDSQQIDLELPPSLQEKLKSLQLRQQNIEEGYSIGDLIQVRGRLSEFRDQRQMDVFDHCILFKFLFSQNLKIVFLCFPFTLLFFIFWFYNTWKPVTVPNIIDRIHYAIVLVLIWLFYTILNNLFHPCGM